jgi:hypothetical protein
VYENVGSNREFLRLLDPTDGIGETSRWGAMIAFNGDNDPMGNTTSHGTWAVTSP